LYSPTGIDPRSSSCTVAALTTAAPSVRLRRQDVPAYVEGLTAAKSSLEELLAAEVPA
jgi:hypothetical protein